MEESDPSFSCFDLIADSIPLQIGSLTHLLSLDLSNNLLTGSIPTTFGQLVNLKYLYLHSNKLEGNI